MEGLPGLGLLVALLLKIRLNPGVAVGLLTVSGLLSVLFFGLMLQVAERAMTWADSPPSRGPATSQHGILLGELAAHAGYAALVCILAAVTYVVASVTKGWPLRVASSLGLALGGHLVLVLLMIMKRVFLLTQGQLNRARTNPASNTDRKAS